MWLFLNVLSGCGTEPTLSGDTAKDALHKPIGHVVSTAFGPNGRLWRLIPTKNFVFVDYSSDKGTTFSEPVAVNPNAQKIRARPEDRPSIEVDGQGRIFVIYFADAKLPWTTFFSHSSDGGRTFTPPQPASEKSETAAHYQDVLNIGPDEKIYVFWHDERGGGKENIALYYKVSYAAALDDHPDRKIMESVCDCCRSAVDFDSDGLPVLFKRMVYPGSTRDHGIVKMTADGTWTSWRVTHDDWRIEACPEHGPALSISDNKRYHITWFTNGSKRKGLFYAHSDDQGRNFTPPMQFGDFNRLASHADVFSLGDRVTLVWKEFDGETTRILGIHSGDQGQSWTTPKDLAATKGGSDHPLLIRDQETAYLSWNTQDDGYQLVPIR